MDLRSKMLSAPKRKQETITIDIFGEEEQVIVKELSLDERDTVLEMCQTKKEGSDKPVINGNRMIVAYVMLATYDTNGNRLFEDSDFETLIGLPESTTYIDEIYEKVKEFNEPDKGLSKADSGKAKKSN